MLCGASLESPRREGGGREGDSELEKGGPSCTLLYGCPREVREQGCARARPPVSPRKIAKANLPNRLPTRLFPARREGPNEHTYDPPRRMAVRTLILGHITGRGAPQLGRPKQPAAHPRAQCRRAPGGSED